MEIKPESFNRDSFYNSKEELLSYGDLNFILSISKYIGKNSLPTAAQCKRLVKIVTKAEDAGYVLPNQ